jgi:hypothetical protein
VKILPLLKHATVTVYLLQNLLLVVGFPSVYYSENFNISNNSEFRIN